MTISLIKEDIGISIVICTLNRRYYLENALESILRQKLPLSSVEVLVIDNGSTDDTFCLVNKISQESLIPIYYYYETTIGISSARNRGIRNARGEIVVFLDDDEYAHEEWLCAHWNAHKSIPMVGCVAGRIILDWCDLDKPKWLSRPLSGYLGMFDLGDFYQDIRLGDLYPGCGNVSFRKEVLQRLRGFRTDLGRWGAQLGGGEDTELVQRILEHGYQVIYTPDALVRHVVLSHKIEKQYFRNLAHALGVADVRIGIAHGETLARLSWRNCYRTAKSVVAYFIRLFDMAKSFETQIELLRVIGRWVGIYNELKQSVLNVHRSAQK